MNTKKTYQQPQIQVTHLNMQYHLLEGSNTNTTLGVGSRTVSAEESLSRQGSFWFDEEEEEATE